MKCVQRVIQFLPLHGMGEDQKSNIDQQLDPVARVVICPGLITGNKQASECSFHLSQPGCFGQRPFDKR
ncbi:hypothetical protein D3C79_625070 [compost metagenome]